LLEFQVEGEDYIALAFDRPSVVVFFYEYVISLRECCKLRELTLVFCFIMCPRFCEKNCTSFKTEFPHQVQNGLEEAHREKKW
jgi:hypothetical protein